MIVSSAFSVQVFSFSFVLYPVFSVGQYAESILKSDSETSQTNLSRELLIKDFYSGEGELVLCVFMYS